MSGRDKAHALYDLFGSSKWSVFELCELTRLSIANEVDEVRLELALGQQLTDHRDSSGTSDDWSGLKLDILSKALQVVAT